MLLLGPCFRSGSKLIILKVPMCVLIVLNMANTKQLLESWENGQTVYLYKLYFPNQSKYEWLCSLKNYTEVKIII